MSAESDKAGLGASPISRRAFLRVGTLGTVAFGAGSLLTSCGARPPSASTTATPTSSTPSLADTLGFVYTGHMHGFGPGHDAEVYAVDWSPNSKRIASGGSDNTVQVWDAYSGGHRLTFRGHGDIVYALAWSPDGRRIVSAGYDGSLLVWDAATGGHVYSYRGHTFRGQPSHVFALAWSPDSARVVSGGDDSTVQVWNATDGKTMYISRGYQGTVNSLAWSPDGKRIAVGCDDLTVR